MHAGEQVGVDDVAGGALHDGLLVGFDRIRLFGGDEGRAHVGQVRPGRQRRQDGIAVGDGARQQQRAVEPLADLVDQRERRGRARMAARPGRHRDQPVRALVDRLLGEGVVDDVMQHDAAIAVHRVVDLLARAQRGDDDGHLVFHAQCQVVLEPVVGLVHDLVDGERRRGLVRMLRIVFGQRRGDALQPGLQQLGRARVQRRERADHAGLALGDHEIRIGDDEQRRAHHGHGQAVLQDRRQ